MDFNRIKQSIREGHISWQKHALQRILERSITRNEVKHAILSGSIIEDYSDDHPFPSMLVASVLNLN